jgi:hypothetical protein
MEQFLALNGHDPAHPVRPPPPLPPVLTGHVSSLLPYQPDTSHLAPRGGQVFKAGAWLGDMMNVPEGGVCARPRPAAPLVLIGHASSHPRTDRTRLVPPPAAPWRF